jgi:hypothetical protein
VLPFEQEILKMAASNPDSSKDQPKPTKPASDTVNLTPEELRRISAGAGVGKVVVQPTPKAGTNANSNT